MLGAAGEEHSHALLARLVAGGAQHPGLADAARALDDEQLPRASTGAGEELRHGGELRLPLDQIVRPGHATAKPMLPRPVSQRPGAVATGIQSGAWRRSTATG